MERSASTLYTRRRNRPRCRQDRILLKLGADLAYTLDAGERGTLEDETFSADAMTVIFSRDQRPS